MKTGVDCLAALDFGPAGFVAADNDGDLIFYAGIGRGAQTQKLLPIGQGGAVSNVLVCRITAQLLDAFGHWAA
jgi:hypothetical protein